MSTLTDFLKGIADAIRGKTGETESIAASDFARKISEIETGVDTWDATATPDNIDLGYTAYACGTKLEGTSTKNADTSGDSVEEYCLLTGITAHDRNGNQITGTMSPGFQDVDITLDSIRYEGIYNVLEPGITFEDANTVQIYIQGDDSFGGPALVELKLHLEMTY